MIFHVIFNCFYDFLILSAHATAVIINVLKVYCMNFGLEFGILIFASEYNDIYIRLLVLHTNYASKPNIFNRIEV